MTRMMTAALFYAPEDIRIEQVPVSEPGPGEVLLRIGSALTCGTDFKTFRRGHPVIIKTIPSGFGHEMAGTVDAIGEGVKKFKVGDRVVPANSAPCLECYYCQSDLPNLCEDLLFINGAYAEYIIIPQRIVERNLYAISENVSFAEAALSEPLACVIHALDKMQTKAGESIAIIGTGPMAMIFIQVAGAMECHTTIIGRSQDKLEIAKSLGADVVLNQSGDLIESLKKASPSGHGADLVIEAVGQPETWKLAVDIARKGGRICLYGGCAKDTLFNADSYRIHYEELQVGGVFHHTPKHFKRAVDMIAEGAIDAKKLIMSTKPLSQIHEVFDKEQTSNPPLKIAVIP